MTLCDEQSIEKFFSAALESSIVAVDTETSGLNVKDGSDYLIGVSLAFHHPVFNLLSTYIPIRHETDNLPKKLVLDYLNSLFNLRPIVFHNHKFDRHSLTTLGVTLPPADRCYDTMMLAHMVNEEWYSKSLDSLSKMLLKEEKINRETDPVFYGWVNAFGWGTVPPKLIADYACRDAELTLKLFKFLWPQMVDQELDKLWPTETMFTDLLYRMEKLGIRVNTEFCKTMADRGVDRMDDICELLGDLNPGSTKDLATLFFDDLRMPILEYTPNGKPSLNKHVMEEYDILLAESDNETAKLVLEYRGWQKATSSLYQAMLDKVSSDGRVHPNYKQHGTKTGRLSCSEPNLQQIPRKSDKPWNGSAKQAFLATEGFELWGYDYSQLELRLAATYGSEMELLEEFNTKEKADPFSRYVPIIFGEYDPEDHKKLRQDTKTFFYSNIYGAGLAKVAYTLGRTIIDTEPLYERFKASISGIRQASQHATYLAQQRRYVRYWNGRRRHLPRDEEHKAFNSILQGGAAELVKAAMIRIDKEVCDENCRIVLQVHDEIVFEIAVGMREKYEPEIIRCMTDFPQFGVRFEVEGKLWNQ